MQASRLQAKRYLITFSQTGNVGDLHEVMGYHIAYLPPLSYYLLCRENHPIAGGVHHHLVLVFKEKLRITTPRFFDFMFDGNVAMDVKTIKHTNKDLLRSINYVKGDGDFVEDGVDPLLPSKVPTMQRISKLILENKSRQEIELQEHSVFLMHDQKIQRSIDRQFERQQPPLQPWVAPIFRAGLQFGDVHDESVMLIGHWLEENIRKPLRGGRAPHLWIWGPTGVGKSTLIRQVSTMLKVFDAPKEGKQDWMTGYSDDYDLVVFDEFHAEKTIGFLKAFLQGYPMKVAQKTIGPVHKRRHTPCIFTCNASPEQLYHNYSQDPLKKLDWDAFMSRLVVCPVTRFFNLYPLIIMDQ